jgi:hypothetical protein
MRFRTQARRMTAGAATLARDEHTMASRAGIRPPHRRVRLPGTAPRIGSSPRSSQAEKTSTTGLYEEYLREGTPIEVVDSRSLVVDSAGTGVGVIETTEVAVKPDG